MEAWQEFEKRRVGHSRFDQTQPSQLNFTQYSLKRANLTQVRMIQRHTCSLDQARPRLAWASLLQRIGIFYFMISLEWDIINLSEMSHNPSIIWLKKRSKAERKGKRGNPRKHPRSRNVMDLLFLLFIISWCM